MIIRLANGTELNPISAIGEKRTVQGAYRDTISFIFPVETSLDELDALFTTQNCEKITIFEGEDEFIHDAYTVRVELKREPVEIEPATAKAEAVYENRAIITMGQRTYTESQIAEQAAILNTLLNGEE